MASAACSALSSHRNSSSPIIKPFQTSAAILIPSEFFLSHYVSPPCRIKIHDSISALPLRPLHMDSLFSFPVEDDRLLFQAGVADGYDFPIFEDLMLQEQMFDVADWECTASFGVLGAVDAIPNGIPLVEAAGRGGGAADRTDVMKPSRDRSKTIVSERKRRGRMKERLYELRSMVPNITKMDKSSIIGDAVAYVRELQGQEKKLAEEIRNLESSSTWNSACSRRSAAEAKEEKKRISRGEILGVMAHQVGEKRFQAVIECSGEDGASAASLYNAVHALECFRLESAAIARASDRYVCTLTFDCGGMREEMNAATMKYWVVDSLLKDGFPFITNSTH